MSVDLFLADSVPHFDRGAMDFMVNGPGGNRVRIDADPGGIISITSTSEMIDN